MHSSVHRLRSAQATWRRGGQWETSAPHPWSSDKEMPRFLTALFIESHRVFLAVRRSNRIQITAHICTQSAEEKTPLFPSLFPCIHKTPTLGKQNVYLKYCFALNYLMATWCHISTATFPIHNEEHLFFGSIFWMMANPHMRTLHTRKCVAVVCACVRYVWAHPYKHKETHTHRHRVLHYKIPLNLFNTNGCSVLDWRLTGRDFLFPVATTCTFSGYFYKRFDAFHCNGMSQTRNAFKLSNFVQIAIQCMILDNKYT